MQSKIRDSDATLQLIKSAQSGDLYATNKLAIQFERFFHKIVRKYSKKTWIKDDDDLLSYIHLGFLESIKRFDPAKETYFMYFAGIWMKKNI